MKTNHLFFLLLSATVLFSACKEIQTPNGEIPEQYVSAAQSIAGNYYDAQMNRVEIKINGNQVSMMYFGKTKKDFYAEGCQSQFGLLQKIKVDGGNQSEKVGVATFGFNGGMCDVAGNTIAAGIRQNANGTQLNLKVLEGYQQGQDCNMPTFPPNGPIQCKPTQVAKYFQRAFVKQ